MTWRGRSAKHSIIYYFISRKPIWKWKISSFLRDQPLATAAHTSNILNTAILSNHSSIQYQNFTLDPEMKVGCLQVFSRFGCWFEQGDHVDVSTHQTSIVHIRSRDRCPTFAVGKRLGGFLEQRMGWMRAKNTRASHQIQNQDGMLAGG